MDYESIILNMLPSTYQVEATEFNELPCLLITAEIAGKIVELIHFCEEEMTRLPVFHLKNANKYPVLAHVIKNKKRDIAYICVNDVDAVSVNFERPELAFEESLNRTIELLTKAIDDPVWNKAELLREFKVNWDRIPCAQDWQFSCAIESTQIQKLTVYFPIEKAKLNLSVLEMLGRTIAGVDIGYIGIPEQYKDELGNAFLNHEGLCEQVDGTGLVIPLDSLAPAPESDEQLEPWFIDALTRIAANAKSQFHRRYKQLKAKNFWLIFNGPTKSKTTETETTWFGIKLTTPSKKALPCKLVNLENWRIEPFRVSVLNKDSLMPRSGANPRLDEKKVLLVGCGSVGSELAMKLGSAGIGHLDICDPDKFSLDNVYRHTLSKHAIGEIKSKAVESELKNHFPWIKAAGHSHKLLNLREAPEQLNYYDLILIAIGVPTHERLFKKFMLEQQIDTPVINCWLEGYGIGGHAVIDIPQSKGGLCCAYVENQTRVRGLASNLNFFKQDQVIVKNMAGCGETFIPYGAISSAQTALMTADLAIKYLEGRIEASQKVSWQGDAAAAIEQGIELSPRYHLFQHSFVPAPLYNPNCKDCRGIPAKSFEGQRLEVHVAEDVWATWQSQRQLSVGAVESAGLLIGRYETENVIWLDGITKPKPSDYATPSYFKLDDAAHQLELIQTYNESEATRSYFGTWHTHPQDHPIPSKLDKKDWRKHVKDNKDRHLIFVIIGRQSVKLFTINAGQFKALQLVE